MRYLVYYLTATSEETSLIVILAVLIVCSIYASVYVLVTSRNNNLVRENSEYYKSVVALNARTVYHRYIADAGKVEYVLRVNSKAKYDKTETIASLHEYLRLFSKDMKQYLAQAAENRVSFHAYCLEFGELSSTITPEECKKLRISYEQFQRIEQKMVGAVKLDMIQEISAVCYVSYTSPQGRNHYAKKDTYLESEIRTEMKNLATRAEYERSETYRRKTERSRITPAVRYRVMSRDNFRCCLCGRSAANGVELEVDHIMPISKGGSSDEKNLQTLCRDCNRGKGASV